MNSIVNSQRTGWFRRILAAFLVLAVIAPLGGCASSAGDSSSEQSIQYEDAESLLNAVWEAIPEKERPMIIGGVGNNVSETMPLALDLNDPELLSGALGVPESLVKDAQSGASMMNGMMANHFTASAWKLKQDQDAGSLSQLCSDHIKGVHWVCGTPEEYVILCQGDFLIVCYGLSDQISPFIEAAQSVLPQAQSIRGVIED